MSADPRLKVLVVSHGHPTFSLGGGEVASFNLHKGLNQLTGARSIYLARVAKPVPRHGASALMSLGQRPDEILFHADDYDHFLVSNRSTDDIERDLLRFVRAYQPDVVHFHHLIGFGLETLFAIREALPDAVIVLTLHEMLAICHHHGQMVKKSGALCTRAGAIDCHHCFPEIAPARFLQRERFIRGMLDLVDQAITPSRFLAERFADWGFDRERLAVIENGLDIAGVAPPRPLVGEGARRSRFAYFGQLIPSKGIEVLLDAITRVPEAVWGDDSRLMIFGSNLDRQPAEFQARVKTLIDRAGARVRFYGPYQNTEMPRLMRSADWVVLPSTWWENSPVVIQEAFFHGRPVIAGNIGGMAEKVTDGVDGLHYRVGSAEDLADRITEVLTEPGLWQRLRDGITAPVGHVDCARRHLELYRTVIDRRAGGSALAEPLVQAAS